MALSFIHRMKEMFGPKWMPNCIHGGHGIAIAHFRNVHSRNLSLSIIVAVFAILNLSSRAATFTVGMRGSVFDPIELTIHAGDTVLWINDDITEHTVNSLDGLFDSSDMSTDDQFSYKFAAAGDFGYYCVIHGFGMGGTVHVSPAAANNPPAKPVNQAPADGANSQSVTVELQASAFSDADGDTHAASQWILRFVTNGTVAVDSGEITGSLDLTKYAPAGLTEGTAYEWQARYKDSRGTWSEYSTATRFTTLVSVNTQPAELKAGGITNGNWHFTGSGFPFKIYTILGATNLTQWINLGSTTGDVSGGFHFVDSNIFVYPYRYYRTTNQ
jgi:plastocyanin